MSLDVGEWKNRLARVRDDLGWNRSGSGALRGLLDSLIQTLGRGAGWDRPGCAVVALGGYGRGALAPYSDVDLLFLVKGRRHRARVEPVLYPLWDLGLDVGHAVRTPKDCRSVCRDDLTAATALLDARLILGDPELLAEARGRAGLAPPSGRNARRWAAMILEDVRVRRERFGGVSHLLEPHVKEGRGGLRDLQACRWGLAFLGMDPQQTLFSSPPGRQALAAETFLGRVRNALHGAAGRKTDHLTYEYHSDVAARVVPHAGPARLFAELHTAGHAIQAAWEAAADILRARVGRPSRPSPPPPDPAGDPGALARQIEALAPDHGARDFARFLGRCRPDALRAALPAAAGRLLRRRVPAAPFFTALHDLGLLAEIHPLLGEAAHTVPYDARHVYTVGVHGIETLRALEDLWLGKLEDREPYLSRVAGSLARPHVLRVAALVHDIGKLRDPDHHAPAGGDLAGDVARRLGLSEDEAADVGRLVERHHVLPDLAFGRDLEDPATWAETLERAGPGEDLDALAALAFADLSATRPGPVGATWNDWVRNLLLTLHARAGKQAPETAPALRGRRLAPRAFPGIPGALLDRVPEREALQVPPDLLAILLRMTAHLGDRPAVWEVVASGGPVEVLGAAQARPRLLPAATAALARLGFDVRMFQVHAWNDGTVHLWFRCLPPDPPPAPDRVKEALSGSLSRRLPETPQGLSSPRVEAMPVETRVELRPGSPFHSEIHVRCRDRRGLLADLTRALDELGLTVVHALVTTHGPQVRDVFHVKDIFGGRIDGADKQRAVLERIRAAIQGKGMP